jgi:hypothetical protein
MAAGQDGPPAQLVREWMLCAVAAAAARFVPVPFLDDVIRERATRLALTRTLKARGRTYPADAVEPLYAGIERWGSGALKTIATAPAKLVLFPVRKYVAVFGSVRGVPTDVVSLLLLARSVDRALARGLLSAHDPRGLRREAVQVRRAYERSFDGMDLQLLAGAVREAFSRGEPMTDAAVRYARELLSHNPLRRDGADPEPGDAEPGDAEPGDAEPGDAEPGDAQAGSPRPGTEVDDGVRHLEETLRRPELAQVISAFDARFDALLAADARGSRRP